MRSTDSSPSVAPAGVHQVLEAVHRHLAEHGRDRAVDALGEQARAAASSLAALSSSRPNTSVSPNTDAVSASVSGVRLMKQALRLGERRVQAVPELVRHASARRGAGR